MKITIAKRDIGFYPMFFGAWALLMVVAHHHYAYFGTPFPDANLNERAVLFSRMVTAESSMAQLKKSSMQETDVHERAHIEENLGLGYFSLYKEMRNPPLLDSAEYHLDRALSAVTDIAQFYYNLARINAEKKNFEKAKILYEKTVELDPRHCMALQNLGFLCYDELHQLDAAKGYFQKALEIDAALPIGNYMLGEIALDVKDAAAAVHHYEKELTLFASGATERRLNLADPSSVRLAATLSAMQLSFLYSGALKNPALAHERFNLYLKLETDPQRRQTSLKEMQKYRCMAGSGGNRVP
jgi:tetratricopeptide (TPR) repeat protein